jgi:hypothetical protein
VRAQVPGRPKRWTLQIADGVVTVTLTRWRYFPDLVSDSFRDPPDYIYRGQASSDWPLEPTLDRTPRLRGSLADAGVRAAA